MGFTQAGLAAVVGLWVFHYQPPPNYRVASYSARLVGHALEHWHPPFEGVTRFEWPLSNFDSNNILTSGELSMAVWNSSLEKYKSTNFDDIILIVC